MMKRSSSAKSARKRKPKPTVQNKLAASNGPPARVLSRSRSSSAHRWYERQISSLELELTRMHLKCEELEHQLQHTPAALQYYTSLFEEAPIGYLTLDELGFLHQANQQARQLLGAQPNQSLTGPFIRFLQPESVKPFLEHLRKCSVSRGPIHTELGLRASAGPARPIELISVAPPPPPLSWPGPRRQTWYRTAILDISQRRAAEAALARSQQDFRLLVDSAQGIVWEADPRTGALQFISKRAETLLGYRMADWYQPGFWQNCVHVEDRERVARALAQALREHAAAILEYRMVAADRRLVWLRNYINVLSQEGNTRLFGVAVEITGRKLAEQKLQRAHDLLEQRVAERTARLRETVAELEAFSYSLSHDMRAPLRAMHGYAHVLLQLLGPRLDPQAQDFLNRIIRSSTRLDALIQDVLKYSQITRSPLTLKPIALEPLIEQIIHDYPALQSPHAQIEIHRPLLPVLGHEAFLSQCIANLLSNAVRFVRPGETPRVQVSTHPIDDQIEIWFQDNGIGIAPQDQHRIFGIFQRLHPSEQYEGTGIGLAIVKRAAERMRGHVGVESALGQGSKFWLRLQKPGDRPA